MSTQLVSAMIAASVSIVVGLLGYMASKWALLNARELQTQEQKRRLTEKLYEIRLHAYPRAFAITDRLRGENIFNQKLSSDFLTSVLDELFVWHRSKAGFVLSTESIKAFYQIRGSLGQKPAPGTIYSEEQKQSIWNAKNNLRATLRADLHLLYIEESMPEARIR
ncbi:MAG: hypothetical protein OEZ58_04865 [Gammaproteobacteria bacterium]|nr:hypothetical protein [Gammaproteobacteria bacterium]